MAKMPRISIVFYTNYDQKARPYFLATDCADWKGLLVFIAQASGFSILIQESTPPLLVAARRRRCLSKLIQ